MTIFFENDQFKNWDDEVIPVSHLHKHCFEDVEFRGDGNTLGGLMAYFYENRKFELFFEDFYEENSFPDFRRELHCGQLNLHMPQEDFVTQTSHLVFSQGFEECGIDSKKTLLLDLAGVTAKGHEDPDFPDVRKSLEYQPARYWVKFPVKYDEDSYRLTVIQLFEAMWNNLTYSTDQK